MRRLIRMVPLAVSLAALVGLLGFTSVGVSADFVHDDLRVVGFPVLIPAAGQPYADRVPTQIVASPTSYQIWYGEAPTYLLTGTTDPPLETDTSTGCLDQSQSYCAFVILTGPDGQDYGVESFYGYSVNGAPATVSHASCCNGEAWSIQWSSLDGTAHYTISWKGQNLFAPFPGTPFDPDNVQYAQPLVDIASALIPWQPAPTATPVPTRTPTPTATLLPPVPTATPIPDQVPFTVTSGTAHPLLETNKPYFDAPAFQSDPFGLTGGTYKAALSFRTRQGQTCVFVANLVIASSGKEQQEITSHFGPYFTGSDTVSMVPPNVYQIRGRSDCDWSMTLSRP